MKDSILLKQLVAKVYQHEKRISTMERQLIVSPPTREVEKNSKKKKSLSGHLLELHMKGFFKAPKTAIEAHGEVLKKYPCELNRVAVALVRLSTNRELRTVSKTLSGKKYRAYVS